MTLNELAKLIVHYQDEGHGDEPVYMSTTIEHHSEYIQIEDMVSEAFPIDGSSHRFMLLGLRFDQDSE